MKTILKRLSACAVAVVAAVGLAVPAWAAVTLPDLPQSECVVDDADVLSEDTTAYLEQLNGQLEASCSGAQIGVLTVQYTGSASTEEYALEAFNAWGIGSKEHNNGVLLLLVMESPLYADGDYYLTYGDGFRNTTIDRQASTLSQTMEDDFAARNYDAAVRTCADAVAGAIADIYGVDLASGQPAPADPPYGSVMNLGVFVLVGALAVVMLILVFGNWIAFILATYSSLKISTEICFPVSNSSSIPSDWIAPSSISRTRAFICEISGASPLVSLKRMERTAQ